MKKLFFFVLVLGGVLLFYVVVIDICIYFSFIEVCESVSSGSNMLIVVLLQEVWDGVIQGSLDFEGLSFNSVVQKLEVNWLSGLEGKMVYFKCDGGKIELVMLVCVCDLLVKDVGGKYFIVWYEDL